MMTRDEGIEASLPAACESAVAARLEQANDDRVVERVWAKDATLWAPEGTPEVADRLGWLTIAERLRDQADELKG
jgi:glucose-6-phosphate isomerase/transaldolase/glucose-6-phosphate isomerase